MASSGLISGYTGHVPVSRDRFGCSFVPKVDQSMETFRRRKTELEKINQRKLQEQIGTLELSQESDSQFDLA